MQSAPKVGLGAHERCLPTIFRQPPAQPGLTRHLIAPLLTRSMNAAFSSLAAGSPLSNPLQPAAAIRSFSWIASAAARTFSHSCPAAQGGGSSRAASAPSSRSSIQGVLADTVRREGVRGIYRGISPTLAGILPYAGLKFYVYQSLKQQYRSTEGHSAPRLPIAVMLTFGAGAGLIAQTATYPLDVVRRQMQVSAHAL